MRRRRPWLIISLFRQMSLEAFERFLLFRLEVSQVAIGVPNFGAASGGGIGD